MKVYFTTDENYSVFPCCDFREDIEPDNDWRIGDLDGNPFNDYGVPLYKFVDGEIIPRDEAEIEADMENIEMPEPTQLEQLQADVDFLSMENEYVEAQNEQFQADIDFLTMENEYFEETVEKQQADIDFCLMMLDEDEIEEEEE